MIKIIDERITEENQKRHADIIISDTVIHYALGVGGLPLVGDLQTILEAEEASLWRVAVAKNNSLTAEEVRLECYNSPIAGGWTINEFQEAVAEDWAGDSTKRNRIISRRAAIRAEWPL